MPRGYAGKYLDVDLTRETIEDVNFDWETLEAYFGGRGSPPRYCWIGLV